MAEEEKIVDMKAVKQGGAFKMTQTECAALRGLDLEEKELQKAAQVLGNRKGAVLAEICDGHGCPTEVHLNANVDSGEVLWEPKQKPPGP
jgi:hypothetical protein